MQQPIVIYLTHATPSVVGNGGVHRSYQVLHELQQAVGVDQVLVITADFLASLVNNGDKAEGNGSHGSDGKLRQWVNFRFGTATRFVKNPYRLFHRTPFATGLHPLIKNYYASRLKELSSTRTICLFDHAQFSELIPINRQFGVPTISCTQNLDALGDDFDSIASNLAAHRRERVRTQERLRNLCNHH